MVEQARLAVFKAVAVATSFNAISQSPASTIPQFHTALNLSKSSPKNLGAKVTIATPPSNKPVKSTSTAPASKIPASSTTAAMNRAPSLTISKTRKNRSVTWDNQLDHRNSNSIGHNVKRRKFSEPATLKSSRSFGKPDASFFETNRNATFAEFGRPPMHLFVNGKLATPNNNTRSMANIRAMKSVGNFSTSTTNNSSKGNATFSAASLSLSQRLQHRNDAHIAASNDTHATPVSNNKPTLFSFSPADPDKRKKLKPTIADSACDSNSSVNNQMHIPQPSLPRTPTALEGFLLAKTTSSANANVIRNSSSGNIVSKKRSLPPDFL